MRLDEITRTLWRQTSPQKKTAFFSCLVTGLLVHLYAFTNLIPNSDGIGRVFDLQQMTVSGRFLLHYASWLNGFTQMPMVIGLLSVLWLSLSAVVVCQVLSLHSRTLAGVTGACMASFPCLGYTFLYLFTASAYCLAIFLAVVSVLLARSGKAGFVLGALFLAMSMGIYQSYVALAIGLVVLLLLRECLTPQADFPATLRLGLRLGAYLAAGAVLYYVILLLWLRLQGLELLSYLGMDSALTGYPLGDLPRLLLQTYKQVAVFFLLPGSAGGFTSVFMVMLTLSGVALGAVCFALRMSRQGFWRQPWRVIGAAAMVALLPLGINFGQILSPFSVPTPLMKYAFVLVYLSVVVMADLWEGSGGGARVCPALFVVWVGGLLLFNLNTNNLLYTASAQAHRATESYATRLLTRIESCPGYVPGMEVVVIGAFPADEVYSQIPSYRQIDHYSVPLNTVIPLNKHIYYYLNHWLNVPVEEPAESVMLAVSASPEFSAMPRYPAPGSVALLDGRLVVKVQEEYTPKSDFELAYEASRG